MANRRSTLASVAAEIRRMLRRGGSAEHAKGVQWFFKEDVKSYGWRTADLRKAARRWRREILKQFDLDFLLQAADRLYRGK